MHSLLEGPFVNLQKADSYLLFQAALSGQAPESERSRLELPVTREAHCFPGLAAREGPGFSELG